MTRNQTTIPATLLLATLCLAPARAEAQAKPTAAQIEALGNQEKEMLGAAQDFARRVTESMEGWLAAREVSEERLFASMYYPIAKTDPPKFTTDWDRFADRDVQGIEEAIMTRSQSLVFAVLVDKNGYLPTHNLRYSQPLTGNLANDLVNNRTKRIFNDPVGLAAAKNLNPSLQQDYFRDTGERMWDVSSPIYVKGKHWGGFRVAVSMERIAARKRDLVVTLAVVFAAFAAITILTMYVVVERAMRPVVELTAAAASISMGDGLETPIKSQSTDEIGQLTKAVERLRVSMKAAMSRLGA